MRYLGAVLLCLASGPALAWDSPAPDVVLYCTPALEQPLLQVAGRYTAQTHVGVHIFVAPPEGLIGLLQHRARADVVVAGMPTLQAMAAQHLVRMESIAALGADAFVLIANTGAAPVPGSGAAALLASHATALPDPTTAATFDGAALLHAAFPGAAVTQTRGFDDTPAVVAAVRADRTLLGLVYRSEARQPGVAEIAALPALPTPIAGALVTLGQSRNAAALLDFIAGPEGQSALHAAGLEARS